MTPSRQYEERIRRSEKALTVIFPDYELRRFKRWCARNGISMSRVVREALTLYERVSPIGPGGSVLTSIEDHDGYRTSIITRPDGSRLQVKVKLGQADEEFDDVDTYESWMTELPPVDEHLEVKP